MPKSFLVKKREMLLHEQRYPLPNSEILTRQTEKSEVKILHDSETESQPTCDNIKVPKENRDPTMVDENSNTLGKFFTFYIYSWFLICISDSVIACFPLY